jgi:hypothetical protein
MTTRKTTTKRGSTAKRASASAAAGIPVWLRKRGTLLLTRLRTRVERDGHKALREGRKALRQVEARRAELQARLRRDRVSFGRRVDEAVRGTLVRFNIPNRREIAELTRKVEDLSRKIDAFRARPRHQGARA